MCGRFTQDLDEEEIVDLYDLDWAEPRQALRSRWNGAPTQEFALCRMDHAGRRILAQHRWGLVPAWARDPKIGARLINARSESAESKPSFRAAFRRRRCLIPANGWFEWQAAVDARQPWWISLGSKSFSFAGLWEAWDKGVGPVYSFTILTCPATESLQEIHDRQPAIIPPDRYAEWLDPGTEIPRLLELARASHPGPFDCRQVSREVNSHRNDYPEILGAL